MIEQLPAKLAARFEINENDCWLWTGARKDGIGSPSYGVVQIDGVKQYVHRVVYQLLIGPIPAELEIDHLCETRPCANPAHLEVVDHKTNLHRSVRYWASVKMQGSRLAAKRALEGEAGIRARRQPGPPSACPKGHSDYMRRSDGRRRCRTCWREDSIQGRQRRRERARLATSGGSDAPEGGEVADG